MKSPLPFVLGLACVLPAMAGPHAEQFARYDTNRDQKLSVTELAAAPWAPVLAGADVDQDGMVTIEEALDRLGRDSALALRQTLPSENAFLESFAKVDKNHDGALSKRELGDLGWLLKMDRDEDGTVSLPEIKLALAKLRNPWPGPPSDQAPPPFEIPVSKQAPARLKPTEHHIGRRITLDADWKSSPATTATVLALVSPSCPIGKRYLPTLARLEEQFSQRGIAFHFLAINPTDDLNGLPLKGPVHSKNLEPLLAALGAKSSTDVFVLDAAQTLVYRGAIDDQYGLGYSHDSPKQHFLTDALESIIAGQPVAIAATSAPGCALDALPDQAKSTPDYHGRISRLMQFNCLECHRTGGIAPFRLETYAQVKAKSGMIRQVVSDGTMPPWGTHVTVQETPWINDRSLSAADRQDLLAWLAADMPEGDSTQAPLPRAWPEAWMIGTPDKIYQIPEPMQVKAEGIMPYRYVTMAMDLPEDRWIQGWEVQPTAREVVHHVLVFTTPADGRDRKPRGEGNDDFLAAFVPGSNYVRYPDGYGKFIPGGSKLKFQIHYTPNGTATQDQVRLGLIFTPRKPDHVVQVFGIANPGLKIPAGAARHPESASIPVPKPVRLMSLMPHMHVRGQSFRYEITLPNGDVRTLLDVPRYDFNWQHAYRYTVPPRLPAGSRVRAIGWYDNSSANPANPDPKREVRWGEQTSDEMMIGYVEFYQDESSQP